MFLLGIVSCSRSLPDEKIVSEIKNSIIKAKDPYHINSKIMYDKNPLTIKINRLLHSINRFYFNNKNEVKLIFVINKKLSIKAIPNNRIIIEGAHDQRLSKVLKDDELRAVLCHEVGHIILDHWGMAIRNDNSQYRAMQNKLDLAMNVRDKYVIRLDAHETEPISLNGAKNRFRNKEKNYIYFGDINVQGFTNKQEISADNFSISCMNNLGVSQSIKSLKNALIKLSKNTSSIRARLNNLGEL